MTAQDVVENLKNDSSILPSDREIAVGIIESNSDFVNEILNDEEHSSEEKSNAVQNLLNEDWPESDSNSSNL